MSITELITRTATITALGAVCLASLTACAPRGAQEWSWKTAREATADGETARNRIPGLLPADAKDVRLRAELSGYGSQLEFRSRTGITASYCAQGPIEQPPAGGSTATTAWWPKTSPSTGWDCDRWQVFERGGTYFAWDTAEKRN